MVNQLPITAPAGGASPKVGLLGPTNVGKTTYFAVLEQARARPRLEDWQALLHATELTQTASPKWAGT